MQTLLGNVFESSQDNGELNFIHNKIFLTDIQTSVLKWSEPDSILFASTVHPVISQSVHLLSPVPAPAPTTAVAQ